MESEQELEKCDIPTCQSTTTGEQLIVVQRGRQGLVTDSEKWGDGRTYFLEKPDIKVHKKCRQIYISAKHIKAACVSQSKVLHAILCKYLLH